MGPAVARRVAGDRRAGRSGGRRDPAALPDRGGQRPDQDLEGPPGRGHRQADVGCLLRLRRHGDDPARLLRPGHHCPRVPG